MERLIGCVGLVCVDIVNVVDSFPSEDSDQRVQALHMQRGGNASNAAVVLTLLGNRVEFIGHVPDCKQGEFSWGFSATALAFHDLERHNVGMNHVVRCSCKDLPTSTVMINARNGSRTILHHRGGLPEMKFEDFPKLNLECFEWMHFEGRPNLDTIIQAMEMVNRYNDGKPTTERTFVSTELEKPREIYFKNGLDFLKLADLVFVSKYFALRAECNSAVEAVEHIKAYLKPGASVICTWGSGGLAYGTNEEMNVPVHLKARCPGKVVDTLGAGDSFIGAVIHSMSNGKSLHDSAEFGMRVAERKITDYGFDHLGEMSLPA